MVPICVSKQSAQIDLATRQVMDFALDAFTQWAGAHPTQACPDSLHVLDEYMGKPSAIDPWGHEYVMSCGSKRPKAMRGGGIAISSNGPDGKAGTDDDITSWEWDWVFPDDLTH